MSITGSLSRRLSQPLGTEQSLPLPGQSTSTPTASSSSPVVDNPMSLTIAGHSAPTPAASSSLQPVGGGVSASAIQVPHQQDRNQCILPVPYSHYRTGHGGQAIDDAFEPEPPVGRARGHIAVFAITSSHPVNGTPTPPGPPETTPDEEETAFSSYSKIDWPDSHDQDWAHRVIQDTNTEPGQ